MNSLSPMDNRVLVVDDSRAITQFLSAQIKDLTGAEVDTATSLDEATALLKRNEACYFVAVLDLNLPDAPDGEVVDYALAKGLPSIVLTGYIDDGLRDRILEKNVIDYVIKTNAAEIHHVAGLVQRVQRNRQHIILIVDDSKSFRRYLRQLLQSHRFRIIEAADGIEALELLAANPETAMVLTDYHMPNMDGQELIAEIRRSHGRNELAIIGISDRASPLVSAKLLKTGANDFITKPFLVEEFYCRITQNIETIEHIRTIRETATRDFLTKTYNRAYLFETGSNLFENALRGHINMAVAMLDIDFFKKVNDTYGHLVGDVALKQVAATIQKNIRKSDLLGRYGGEEFCVLLTNVKGAELGTVLERVREEIEKLEIPHGKSTLKATISIGATEKLGNHLEDMIDVADGALYRAKEGGRNRVVIA